MVVNGCPDPPLYGIRGWNFTVQCKRPYEDSVESAILGVTLISVFVLTALLYYAFTVLQRDKGAVPGTFQFLVIMTSGAIILLCSVLAWPLNDNDVTCLTKPVLIIVGVALMFGVLCARLYKVWFSFVYRGNLMMIHEILDVDRSRLSQVDTLIVLGVVFTIEAILLIVMYTVEKYKPTCQCLAFNTSNPDSTRFSTCTLNLQFVIITFVVNSIPVVVVGVLAFKTVIEFRKDGRVLGVSKKEVEGFYTVTKSIVCLFVLFVIGVVITYTSGSLQTRPRTRTTYYILRSLYTIMAAIIPVGFLYYNRCRLYNNRRLEELDRDVPAKSQPHHAKNILTKDMTDLNNQMSRF
mmetsp:Transcript_16493/g.18648  ORF Transcript_16493/g.18648 Transcript_16493/m.18648 type:complete len:350 (+) Transcript_16493:392-1441(+)